MVAQRNKEVLSLQRYLAIAYPSTHAECVGFGHAGSGLGMESSAGTVRLAYVEYLGARYDGERATA